MSKDWEQISGDLWPRLVEVAKDHTTITYSEAALWIGTNAQSVGGSLDYIKSFCERNKLPRLDAVVVRKDSGKPGVGFGISSLGAGGLEAEYEKIYEWDWASVSYSLKEVTLNDFIKFVRLFDGKRLETLTRKKPFRIDVGEKQISFTPTTKKSRAVSFDPDIKRYLDIYNGGARQTQEYQDQEKNLRNISYFRAVMAEYTKPQNRTLVEDTNNGGEQISTQKEAVIQARNGQGKFRNGLLSYWDRACSITNVGNQNLLRASHIKPWRDSDNKERLNKFNGLLLTPNLDALFDKGLITFEDNGKIKISREISHSDLKRLGVDNSMSIRKSKMKSEHKAFLSYHREKIFCGKA